MYKRQGLTLSAAKRTRASGKSSGFRGVSKCVKDGRWQARIRVGKKVKYLGRFKHEVEAAQTYDEAALALHGTRAVLNFDLTPEEFEAAAARAAEKRAKFGFDDVDEVASFPSNDGTSRPASPWSSPVGSGATRKTPSDSVGSAPAASSSSSSSSSVAAAAAAALTPTGSSSAAFDVAQERLAALSLISLRQKPVSGPQAVSPAEFHHPGHPSHPSNASNHHHHHHHHHPLRVSFAYAS